MVMPYHDRASLYQSSRFKLQKSGGSFNLFVHVGTLEPLSVENSEKRSHFSSLVMIKRKTGVPDATGLTWGTYAHRQYRI